MEYSIVKMENNDLWVGTFDLSKGFGLEHRYLKRLIEKYPNEFSEFGIVKKAFRNSENEVCFESDSLLPVTTNIGKKRGGQVEEYVINEQQYFFLATLCQNSEKIVKFKKAITKQFFKMRKILNDFTIQKQNAEWIAKRDAGKIERRLETDMIKEFVEYAIKQGSKSANKYYMIISKMENTTLLNIELLNQEFDNMRDHVEGLDLDLLKMADLIVSQALKEGMQREMWYKDIYILARDRVEAFAILMGKSPLRLENKKNKMIA